jgi:acetyltransferase-like isoleucine patch superfamily enzyme
MILNLIRKWRTRSAYLKRLQGLRNTYPTCRIQNVHFDGVSLGDYCALLEGAYLKSVTMGRFSYVSYGSSVINAKIGSFCSIGPNVQIGLGPHPSRDFVSTYPAFYSPDNNGCPKPFTDVKLFDDSVPETVLGHDVWIGANAIIPGGISIGHGAIIAAGAIVTKDVPAYAIVGGNPAKLIRMRFEDAEIEALMHMKWWDWPMDKIVDRLDGFTDIKKFKGTDQ